MDREKDANKLPFVLRVPSLIVDFRLVVCSFPALHRGHEFIEPDQSSGFRIIELSFISEKLCNGCSSRELSNWLSEGGSMRPTQACHYGPTKSYN